MSTVKKLIDIFPHQVRVRLVVLLFAIIIGALLEVAALSIVSPFISILLDSSVIESSSILNFVYKTLAFNNHGAFLAFLSFMLAFTYIFKSIYIFFLTKIQYRFLTRRQVELSDRLLSTILAKPYLYHVGKNPADLHRIVLGDSYQLFALAVCVLQIISDSFMCLFIIAFLLIQSPAMTLTVIGLSLICVVFYFRVFRKKVKESGESSRNSNVSMTKAFNQAIGGIKELKILQRERYFSRQFKKMGDAFSEANQRFRLYDTIPKLLIEAICFGGAFILIGTLILAGTDMEGAVPLMGVFVLASFRLLPAVTRFTGGVNQIVYCKPSVDKVYSSLFEGDDKNGAGRDEGKDKSAGLPISDVSSDIIVDNVTFQYPGSNTPVLKDVSLRIPHKKSVAFVGPTGGGKTTLVDVILGIYTPQSGYVFHNGKPIHMNFSRWARQVGYIPQFIYLLDESILENVAFGIPHDEIDEELVWKSLEQAQLADFVRSLPEEIETIVGDRGIRLSGGQRQRIGIARALYTNPSILVLDEATSSLDIETEKAVMEAIDKFQGEKTMIIIAHRLSTVENCDIIYRVKNGKVVKEKG